MNATGCISFFAMLTVNGSAAWTAKLTVVLPYGVAGHNAAPKACWMKIHPIRRKRIHESSTEWLNTP
jgi:hypothetical protein